MSTNEQDIAISFYVQEIERQNENNFDINELMAEIENTELNNDLSIPQMINYNENYTLKELLLICKYYGFAKEVKQNKYNKELIIDFLVTFETDINNSDIVFNEDLYTITWADIENAEIDYENYLDDIENFFREDFENDILEEEFDTKKDEI